MELEKFVFCGGIKHLATMNVTDFTVFKLSMPVSVQCTDI